MFYEKELNFTKQLLNNFRINLRYLSDKMENPSEKSLGLRDILNYSYDQDLMMQMLHKQCKPNTIYQIYNPLMCNYFVFRLPDTDPPTYAYIGPYLLKAVTQQEIYKIAEKYNVTSGNLKQVEDFYQNIPHISDETILLTVLYTLGAAMWGGVDNFTVQRANDFDSLNASQASPLPEIQTLDEALLSMQVLEERYHIEHQLMHAVSAGQTHKAELCFATLTSRQFERRNTSLLRDLKNYGFVLNTILRMAAENGAVHPIHLDSISSKYARSIEVVSSESALESLMKEMIRKYCLLVKNHSLKGYSLLIRKVITRIDSDITADLSLKAQAEALNVNSSYLSTLFKKETGITLTEYVNRKRIERAILLLNSTDMQIQTIAQYCGIPDVNYFTKTFKKMIEKTPKEYRELITNFH